MFAPHNSEENQGPCQKKNGGDDWEDMRKVIPSGGRMDGGSFVVRDGPFFVFRRWDRVIGCVVIWPRLDVGLVDWSRGSGPRNCYLPISRGVDEW